MSNQNFVSYGDAETLMSGIASKISGGGESGSKEVVDSYTDVQQYLNTYNSHILPIINAIGDKIYKCYFLFYVSSNPTNEQIIKMVFSYKDSTGFTFARVPIGSTSSDFDYYIPGAALYINGSSTGAYTTLASKNITKIEFIYDTTESTVNVSVTRKTVAEYTTTSQTFNQIGADLYPKLSALTDAQRLKSSVVIEADGTGTDFPFNNIKIPYSSQLNVKAYIFDSGRTYNGNYHFYVHQNGVECGLQITNSTQLGGNSILATRGITKIGVYYDEAEDITSAVQTELDSLDARVDVLEQSGGGGTVIVDSVTNTSLTFKSTLSSFYSKINALTTAQKMRSYIAFYGGDSSAKDFILPWALDTDNIIYSVVQNRGNTNYNLYALLPTNPNGIILSLGGVNWTDATLSSHNVTKIELCYTN